MNKANNERTVETFHYEPPKKKSDSSESKKRVAAYCRVSTLSEEQELSFRTQTDYYQKKIAADPGKVLVGIYGDRGLSGLGMQKRKELQRLINDCRNGLIDIVMVKSVSRFSRNMSECVKTVNELRSLGITVIFEKEGINTSDPSSELFLNILASLAQEESNSISQNIRWARKKRAESGDPVRQACFGYRLSPREKGKPRQWLIIREEAAIVKKAFDLALEGKTYPRILEEMNEMEKSSESGRTWGRVRLFSTLQNEVYKGDVLTNKYYVPDYVTKKLVKNRGEHPQVYIEEHHDAIIEPKKFDRVQMMIKEGMLATRNEAERREKLRSIGIEVE